MGRAFPAIDRTKAAGAPDGVKGLGRQLRRSGRRGGQSTAARAPLTPSGVGGMLGEMAGGHAAAHSWRGAIMVASQPRTLTARWGPREDAMPVASSRPVPLSARERLRDHQAAAAKAVATHATSTARLHAVLSRRAKVIERQDALVEAAKSDVEAAVAAVARAMGIDVAAEVLGLNKAEVRRIAKENP